MSETLNDLRDVIYATNKANGWTEEHETGTWLALIHSEVSEALEADRKEEHAELGRYELFLKNCASDDKKVAFEMFIKDTFEDELADVIIRVLDLCARRNVDIDAHVKAKLEYNRTRGYHHGNKNY